ncbi:MAG: sensor histidine kinase KdpD, partial [Caulobacteraceae bacterium]|nr:sensor histidine kinase KdpD [Caulobacter sp.]
MAELARPDPDALLAHAKRQGRGRLRVYLGMSPGVGKTYEMLEAAQRRRAEGQEVLVGLIETHGRAETEALLAGLEVAPRAPIEHRGQMLMEFDLDAVLARRPPLVLVDEYAHSNAPGARHPKRWQDVDELLDAGIDVWTTLNVQHLESLVDVVWRITGVRQRETVPDRALSDADQILLVDITPEELRARLDAGKVYLPETARLAGDRFFRLENLTALRELALRRAAQTVDDQLSAAMKRGGIQGPWAAGERILVLVAGDAMAPALVRAGRRLADLMMDAPWTVATVELTGAAPPPPGRGRQVAEAMKLAEQLGAATLTLTGADLPQTVLDHARRNNVTQIVLGKPPRRRWARLVGRDLAQALLDRSGGAALHFVTEGSPGAPPREPPPAAKPRGRVAWNGYALAVAAVAVATGLAFVLDRRAGVADVIYLSAVLAAGLLGGLRPALAAALASMILYDFLFLDPIYTLTIGRPTDILTFAIFFAAAGLTGWTAGRVRDRGSLAAIALSNLN